MKKVYASLVISLMLTLSIFKGFGQTFSSVDINPGAGGSDPGGYVEFNNKLYFSATDGSHGTELWVSDGSSAGTTMVKDIWPGPKASFPADLTVFNGLLYFTARDSMHGTELWVSDGTDTGTVLLADIYAGTGNSYPGQYGGFVVMDSILIFTATDSAHGTELWKTNGTTSGTVLLSDIYPGAQSSQPGFTGGFIYCNGLVFFGATNAISGTELWETNGTTGGTLMVQDINPGTASSNAGTTLNNLNGFYALNNVVYFDADNGTNGIELWKTDGTTNGTQMVADIWPGAGNGYPGYYSGAAVYNGKLYFSANDSTHGLELWVSDGTSAGTNLVKDIYPGITTSNIDFLTPYSGKLYFSAKDTVFDQQLFVTDGTPAGTIQVSTMPVNSNSYGLSPSNFTIFNTQLYMLGADTVNGDALYVTTGADTGINLLAPPVVTNSNDPINGGAGALVPFNNMLAFTASYNSIGNELWFYTPAPIVNGIKTVTSDLGITVYPNPFSGNISLKGLQPGVTYTATLLDVTGRIVEQQRVDGDGMFNTPALSSGMYLLQVYNNDSLQTLKIVKQ